MLKTNQEKKVPTDYKEPYEFRLLMGDNIICQRYFKINNFNKLSLNSLELTNTIRSCAEMINEDLKSKTRTYTWYMSPLIFKNEDEMKTWFNSSKFYPSDSKKNKNEFIKNSDTVRMYENIVLRDSEDEYTWDGENLIKCEKKINDGTFTNVLTERDFVTYEFAFYVNDRKVISTIFDGIYPYYIRRNIDLSNSRGKFKGEDISRLGFESYLLNRLVSDKEDLIYKIIEDICYVCSIRNNSWYTLINEFKDSKGKKVNYNLNYNDPKIINTKYAKEIAKAEKYFKGELRD